MTGVLALGGPAAESTAARAGTLPSWRFQEEAEPRAQSRYAKAESTLEMRKENRASAVGETAALRRHAPPTCWEREEEEILTERRTGQRQVTRNLTPQVLTGHVRATKSPVAEGQGEQKGGVRAGRARASHSRRCVSSTQLPCRQVWGSEALPALSVEVTSSAECKTYSHTPVI